MKNLKNIFYLFLILSTKNSLSRSPSIENGVGTLSHKIYLYENNFEKADFDFDKFIPYFENVYNSNSVKNERLKNKLFCILLDFYYQNDPGFAEQFEQQNSSMKCF
ncbi:MAG: hypothetical protein U0T83_05835 [Bacteriovoracaceae bacterium]